MQRRANEMNSLLRELEREFGVLALWRDGDREGVGKRVVWRSEGGQLAWDAVRYEEGARHASVAGGGRQSISGLRAGVPHVEGPATPSHRTAAGRDVRSVLSPSRAGDGAFKHQPSAFPGGQLQGTVSSEQKRRRPASSGLGSSLPAQPEACSP